MKIFISSLVTGFEAFRAAAKAAIVSLGHEPVMVEDFGAMPTSSQIACLQGLRSADLVVLILGARYGYVQGTSGVSPTHEEYLAAKGVKPLLMFTQQGVEREPEQAKLVQDAQAWQAGQHRNAFVDAEDLRQKITLAIHRYLVASASAPVDPAALVARAAGMLPRQNRQMHTSSPMLHVAIAAGSEATILRPAQLEAPALAKSIHRQGLFGEQSLFDPAKGVRTTLEGAALAIEQEGGVRVQVDESGSVALRIPIEGLDKSGGRGMGMSALIEENVQAALVLAFAFANWILEGIDSTHKITHVGLAVSIEAGDYFGWRTLAEQKASPNSMSIGMGGQEKTAISADKPRVALSHQANEMAEDLMVRLRRQWKSAR